MPVSRRRFLSTTASTAATLGLLGVSRGQAAETDDIRIAVIGLRGRGQQHLQSLARNVVAVCDVDRQVLEQRSEKFAADYGRKVARYGDFRELLDRQDIDAVSIATPNHTHALIAVAAAQAGKDVYCEKPTGQSIWESRQIVRAARQYDRIVQCGTQGRSVQSIQQAVAFARTGELGRIRYALGTCYKPRPSIGKLDAPLKIPDTIDYDLWCGPAEKREIYRPHLHYDWHWDFNTGSGDMGNQGIHQMDIARWLLGVDKMPRRVVSIGGRVGYDDAGNTPNSQVAWFDYPDAPLIFETRGLPVSKAAQADWGHNMDRYRGMQIAALLQCEQGCILADNSYQHAYAYDNQGNVIRRWEGAGESHFDNWLRAVASRNPDLLNADIAEGHLSSALCLSGAVSHQLGEKQRADEIAEFVGTRELLGTSFDRLATHLRANDVDIDATAALTLGAELEIDPEAELFIGNDAANRLRNRPQRTGFEVPDLESGTTASVGG